MNDVHIEARSDVSMFKSQLSIITGVLALSFLVAGCGIRPQIDFTMNPVAVSEEQRINEKTGSVTVKGESISITVTALNTADLLKVTSDACFNPYVRVSDWGVARSLYTVFDVAIKNERDSRVIIDPSRAVLIDEQGEQYEAIPYEEFREKYSEYPGFEREVIYYPPPPRYYRYRWWDPWYYRHYDPWWGHGRLYLREAYSIPYLKRSVASGTLLKSAKLYPGGKKQGFLVFPLLPPTESGELKLIIPGVTFYYEEKEERLDFQFNFKRLPAKKD